MSCQKTHSGENYRLLYSLTGWESYSYNLPNKVGRQYDYLFAGSDQIWNYSFSSERFQNYFLQFAAPQKRAAISASFGIEEIPEEWRQQYTEGLSGMRHISVREDAGARIVKELTGREVPVLIDPVMMLDREEWLAVAEKPRVDLSKPYVLKYYDVGVKRSPTDLLL